MSSAQRYIHVKTVYDVAVVRLKTKRVDPQNFEQVAQELYALVDRDEHKRILLCLTDVEYVYSTALVRLQTFEKKVQEAGGELRLCNLEPAVSELFEVTHLDKVFDIRQDERTALDAFW